ncbi:hypothetical protein J2Z58_003835 [Halobacillus andaensis]|nr:hypothetical protein [Halobacillus andaensis]
MDWKAFWGPCFYHMPKQKSHQLLGGAGDFL